MLYLPNFVINVLFKNPIKLYYSHNISTTASVFIKEIRETNEKGTLTIEGIYKESPRVHNLIEQAKKPNFCPECTLGLDIKHTDILILSQYVRSDGCMLPRRITGLCKKQQRKIGTLVTMAQKSGLMSNLTPSYSHKDPKKRFGWKKFNKYYDETTIKC